MNRIVISGEQAFSVPATQFAISPSNEGYTLQYSVDGITFTSYDEATEANTNCVVNFAVAGMIYKLSGNGSTVTVIY